MDDAPASWNHLLGYVTEELECQGLPAAALRRTSPAEGIVELRSANHVMHFSASPHMSDEQLRARAQEIVTDFVVRSETPRAADSREVDPDVP